MVKGFDSKWQLSNPLRRIIFYFQSLRSAMFGIRMDAAIKREPLLVFSVEFKLISIVSKALVQIC